jgi:hypothetical protein
MDKQGNADRPDNHAAVKEEVHQTSLNLKLARRLIKYSRASLSMEGQGASSLNRNVWM